MLAIHVWKPGNIRGGLSWDNDKNAYTKISGLVNYDNFFLEDYEIIIIYLSVLNWQKYNGKIKLFTDLKGLETFKTLEMTSLWNDIDTNVLEQQKLKYNIDQNIFWAASKILVQETINEPFVILDLDLYVETDLDKAGFYSKNIGILHFENSSLSYPDAFTMPLPENFNFPTHYNWTADPVNAALVFFNDLDFKKKYTNMALQYMHNNSNNYVMDKLNARMIFAEQRILGEMIVQENIDFVNIIDGLFYPTINTDNSYGFTDVLNIRTAKFMERDDNGLHYHSNIKEVEHYISHLWGLKHILGNNTMFRLNFTKRLIEKFIKDFPNQYDFLKNSLEIFYKNANQHFRINFSKTRFEI